MRGRGRGRGRGSGRGVSQDYRSKSKDSKSKSKTAVLDPLSGTNDYFLCECGQKFISRYGIVNHVRKCKGIKYSSTCTWCNLKFKCRGSLVTHAKYMHGDTSLKLPEDKVNCNACEYSSTKVIMRHHIRRMHYNLLAKIPLFESFKVNQVWFEKEQNSNAVLEMRKIGNNRLALRKMAPGTTAQIIENSRILNLSKLYPTSDNRKRTICPYCRKDITYIHLKKHIEEHHLKIYRYKCNNCGNQYKRLHRYLRHVCSKGNKRPRTKITIDKVESLTSVPVD